MIAAMRHYAVFCSHAIIFSNVARIVMIGPPAQSDLRGAQPQPDASSHINHLALNRHVKIRLIAQPNTLPTDSGSPSNSARRAPIKTHPANSQL